MQKDYIGQSIGSGPAPAGEPLWRPPEVVTSAERPVGLWAWLTENGSLTERMRRTCGARFNIRVLREHETELDAADVPLLKTASFAGRVREVYLCCARTPWIYARTVMPRSAFSAPHSWLSELGRQALGDALSARGGIRRSALAVAKVDARHSLFHSAASELADIPETLWARRSVVAAGRDYLVIRECFLPELGALDRESGD